MKYCFLIVCVLFMAASMVCGSEELVLRDNFDGSTVGQASGVTFAQGKDNQAVVYSHPSDSISYPAKYFPTNSGRIEFDMMFPQPIKSDRKIWCLLSDVGAGGAFEGALNVMFRDGNNRLEYAIRSGNDHHWCYSKTSDWQIGRWYHITLYYGKGGMKLEVDGELQDSNSCTSGLARTPKRLGFNDPWMDSPSVMIDNLRTYRYNQDGLELSSTIVSPKKCGLFDECSISYELENSADVTLNVVAKDGTIIKSLIDRKRVKSGLHSVKWDGSDTKDGSYNMRLTIQRGSKKQIFDKKIIVSTKWKWHKVKPQFNNFFPTGMYYFCEDDATYINRHIDDQVKAREYYEKTIKDNTDHGVNLFMMVWTPKDHIQMVLDIAKKYNAKVIIHLPDIANALGSEESFYGQNIIDIAWNSIKDIKNHPALAGYYVVDEPSTSPEMTKRILIAKRILEAMDAKHPSFSCLLGSYESLLKTVDYQVLVVDIYPIRPGWGDDLSGFESELQRGIDNAGSRPLWVIPQAFGKEGVWLIPTPAEMRAQVWLSVAYGAKGIVYFIYQSTTGYQGEWLQGLVDMQLKPMDARWEELAKINADMKKLAPALLKLKPAQLTLPFKSDKILAKGFTDRKGNKYAVLVNRDLKNQSTGNWTGNQAMDVLTGNEINNTVTLQPGSGILLKLK